MSADQPIAAVLFGSAGVGKTRLARECLLLAERAGLTPLWVSATRSAVEVPFGALATILPPAGEGQVGPAEDRTEFLHRAVTSLLARTGEQRLALVVDDAQLLDDPSALLVHQLVTTQAAFVLLTVRSGEPVPPPITALWKDDLATRIEVRGLTAEAIDELLGAALGGQIDPAVIANMTARSEGNVMFLRELVVGALADGALVEDGGVWRLVRPLSPSERLAELVEARLQTLSPEERSMVELVSYGEPLGTAELSAASNRELALSLEQQGLLTSALNGRRLEVRLAHPLYGDVLRSRLAVLRATALARSLAESIESSGARRHDDVLRIGVWRLDAGGASPDVMLAAATASRWRFDFPLAERLARAAQQAGAGFEAGLLLGQLESLQGDSVAAESRLAQLVPEDDSQRARLAITRLDNLVFSIGRPEAGVPIALEAESSIVDPAWRDEVTARRTAIVFSTQGARAAVEPPDRS